MFRKSSLDIKERNKKTFFYLFPKRQNFPAYRVAIAANQDTSWAGKKQPLTWCSKEHTFRVSSKIIVRIPPLKIKIKHSFSMQTIHLGHPQILCKSWHPSKSFYISRMVNYFNRTEYRFGLVLGRLAVLNIATRAIFKGNFSMFSCQKGGCFNRKIKEI